MRDPEEFPRSGGLARSSAIVALWLAVVGVLIAVIVIATAVVGELEVAEPWRSTTQHRQSVGDEPMVGMLGDSEFEEARSSTLRLAGSGSNLPLTRELAEAFMRRWPDRRVIDFESVGSTGGIRAASDGVVDLGLVSRPLRASEDPLGLVVIPYAQVAVAAVANLDVADRGLSRERLARIYAGTERRWSDGKAIIVLQRERGDSSHAAVDRVWPEFAAVNDAAYREERWRVLYNDRAMYEALVSTPGSIGLLDVGATQTQALALRVLTLDGIAPSEANLRSGSYPFAKVLAFVSATQPEGIAREFVDFTRSSDGQALIRQRGYVPIESLDEGSAVQ